MEDNSLGSVEERRRFSRADSSLPLRYKNLRSMGGSAIGCLTRDICEGGVRFKTNEFISLACRLVVEITLPASPKPIKAISKVAWIRKIPSGEYYELGNQFLEITKEDKSRINDYVSNIANVKI